MRTLDQIIVYGRHQNRLRYIPIAGREYHRIGAADRVHCGYLTRQMLKPDGDILCRLIGQDQLDRYPCFRPQTAVSPLVR